MTTTRSDAERVATLEQTITTLLAIRRAAYAQNGNVVSHEIAKLDNRCADLRNTIRDVTYEIAV